MYESQMLSPPFFLISSVEFRNKLYSIWTAQNETSSQIQNSSLNPNIFWVEKCNI